MLVHLESLHASAELIPRTRRERAGRVTLRVGRSHNPSREPKAALTVDAALDAGEREAAVRAEVDALRDEVPVRRERLVNNRVTERRRGGSVYEAPLKGRRPGRECGRLVDLDGDKAGRDPVSLSALASSAGEDGRRTWMRKEPPHERFSSPEQAMLHSEIGRAVGVLLRPVPQWHSLLNSTPAKAKLPASHSSMHVAGVLLVSTVVTSLAIIRDPVSTAHANWVVQLRGSSGESKAYVDGTRPRAASIR